MSSLRHATMPFFEGGHDGRRGHGHMARQKELKRLHVIEKVLEGMIKRVEAAEILSLSGRQIRRIVKRIRSEESRGIIHRARGKPSNRRISQKIKERVIKFAWQRLFFRKKSRRILTFAFGDMLKIGKIYVPYRFLNWVVIRFNWRSKAFSLSWNAWGKPVRHGSSRREKPSVLVSVVLRNRPT